MTNIPNGPTMATPQQSTRYHTYILMFEYHKEDKRYWQKLWLINRYVESLEFRKRHSL